MRFMSHRLAPTRATAHGGDAAVHCKAARHHCPVSRVTFASGRNVWVPHRSDWKNEHWDLCYFRDEGRARRASRMGEAYALTLAHAAQTQVCPAEDGRAVRELTLQWKIVNCLPYTLEEQAYLLRADAREALLLLAAGPGARATVGRKAAIDLYYARLAEVAGDELAALKGDGPVALALTAEGAALAAHLRGAA